MFQPSDRSKLMNYLNKRKSVTSDNHQVIIDEGKKLKIVTAKQSQQKYKSDDSNRRLSSFDGEVDTLMKSPRIQNKKQNKKKLKVENYDNDVDKSDLLTLKTTIKKMTPNEAMAKNKQKNSKKRNLQHQDEQILMQDVQNLLANFNSDNINNLDDVGDQYDYFDKKVDEVINRKYTNKKSKVCDKEVNNDYDYDYANSEIVNRSAELGQKARHTLAASMFRSLNEFLYTHDSNQTTREFTSNKFQLYHQTYEKLMQEWPLKPIDYLIEVLKVNLP